jgi:hypothetical protein
VEDLDGEQTKLIVEMGRLHRGAKMPVAVPRKTALGA